ncbi:MAG: secretin N-terminal domain-containing protein [Acidobacteriota bacterium]
MNSLQKISGLAFKAAIALMLVSILGLAVAAQRTDSQSQGRLYGDPGFRGETINLNVVNADIRDILNYITEQYGINFVIDKSVKSVPVTVNVSEVPWNVALDSVLRSQELGVQVNGTILRIADTKTLATEGEIYRLQQDNQLDGSPLYTEFIRLNYARAKGTIVRGTASSGVSTSPTGGNAFAPTGGSSTTGAAASAGAGEGLLPIIQRRLSRRGSVEVDGRSNSLIITDVRQNIDAVRQLIAILDQPEPQVEIEARIVVATRTFSRNLGAELSASVTGPRGIGATADTILNGSGQSNTLIGLTTGIFGTARIDLAITAGEQKGQAKIIATPRVTTLNNRKAKIESKTQIPIQTVQPSQGGGDPIFTTTYVDVPLKLEITPQITDVGTVLLDVLAENASASTTDGSIAPAINSQIMETQVVVPDGGTTVVGGVLFDDERESQNRTPGLSKIPVLGLLFKRKDVARNTNEILFFITPRISRPDFGTAAGQSGVRTTGTVLQPVPLGNPTSNSDEPSGGMPTGGSMQLVPAAQPAVAPVKP